MIKWHIMIGVSIGTMVGAEIARRRRDAAREVYSFVPSWQQRILTAFIIFGSATFFVAAEAAIRSPTAFNIWILIVSSFVSQVSLSFSLNREVHHAKQRLNREVYQAKQRLLDKRNI